jgi:hypothetical protein
LKFLITLQSLLNAASDVIVLLTDDIGSRMFEELSSGSTAGKMPKAAVLRSSKVLASRWLKVVAGAGSVKSSAGT